MKHSTSETNVALATKNPTNSFVGVRQIRILQDYIVVLKRAYNVYEEIEDIDVKIQITSIIKKCNECIKNSIKIKKAILNHIKLYLHNIRTFDKDIILEEGNLLLESI